MGRLGNPSSRGYATPTYSTTQITARETFGGPAKAGWEDILVWVRGLLVLL